MKTSEARELCRNLFLETLDSLQIAPRLRERISVRGGFLKIRVAGFPLYRFQTVRIVAFGKAAVEMAQTAAEILAVAEADVRGVVVAPESSSIQPFPPGLGADRWIHRGPDSTALPAWQYFGAGHPYPNEASLRATDAVLKLLENCTAQDLVLFLVSGGGSALLEKPLEVPNAPSVSMADLRELHRLLVTCGASIQEMNVVRKHFSAVKGGRLAQRAAPAVQVTLFVSDVPDHLPSAVASGPSMPDESTVEDCRRVIAQYGLAEKLPESIRGLLESGQLPETPKARDACFAQSRYDCLLSNRDAIAKVLELARSHAIVAEADTSCDEWPFERAADYLLARLNALRQQHPGRPVLLVSGGELSSPVTPGAEGRGGRNQAFALYCVPKIAGQPVVVLSAGTDGLDGNSPAAGAVADGSSEKRASAVGLKPEEFLHRSDSYGFFERLNDKLVTGPTGTNVRDLRLCLGF